MINQQLLDFVRGQIQKGIDKETISKELLGSGWNTQDISEAFGAISVAPTSPAPMPPSNNFVTQNTLPQEKKHSGGKIFLIVLILFLLAGGASAYYFRDSLSNLPIIKNIFPKSAPAPVVAENPVVNSEPAPVVNVVVPPEVPVVAEKDCGAVTYKDTIFVGWSNNQKALDQISSKSLDSIKCINNALISCTPAKFKVEGTNINPIFPNAKDFKVEDHFFNVSVAEDESKCMLNECAIPKDVILHKSETDKINFLFKPLIGAGPQSKEVIIGQNDIYDPVTKKIIKNVCPLDRNPYFDDVSTTEKEPIVSAPVNNPMITSSTKTTGSDNIYTNTKYNFSFHYPKAWKYLTLGSGYDSLSYDDNHSSNNKEDYDITVITDIDYSGFDALLDHNKVKYTKDSISLDGIQATRILSNETLTLGGGTYHVRSYYLSFFDKKVNNKIVDIKGTCNTYMTGGGECSTAINKIMDTVVSTFKFSK